MASCARCATTENLETHHVVPRCNGGGDGETQVLCHDCHVRLHAAAGHYAAWGLGRGAGGLEHGFLPSSPQSKAGLIYLCRHW